MGTAASTLIEDERKLLTDVHARSGSGTAPGEAPQERELVAALNVLGLRLLGAMAETSAQDPGSAPGAASTLIVSPPLVALLLCAVAAAATLEGPEKLIPDISTVAEELIDVATARGPRPRPSASTQPHVYESCNSAFQAPLPANSHATSSSFDSLFTRHKKARRLLVAPPPFPYPQLPIVDPAVFQAVAAVCQLALLAPASSVVRRWSITPPARESAPLSPSLSLSPPGGSEAAMAAARAMSVPSCSSLPLIE